MKGFSIAPIKNEQLSKKDNDYSCSSQSKADFAGSKHLQSIIAMKSEKVNELSSFGHNAQETPLLEIKNNLTTE